MAYIRLFPQNLLLHLLVIVVSPPKVSFVVANGTITSFFLRDLSKISTQNLYPAPIDNASPIMNAAIIESTPISIKIKARNPVK